MCFYLYTYTVNIAAASFLLFSSFRDGLIEKTSRRVIEEELRGGEGEMCCREQ